MSGFNPYRVFKFVATYSESVQPIWIEKFQSLSGFQVRCNIAYATAQTLPQTTFQSLSGFQVRCNLDRITAKKETVLSFNPYRVFKFVATAIFRKATNEPGSPVSIPIGFSSSLQLPKPSGAVPSSLWFQSLSGFQVRCNIYLSPLDRWIKEVSIPIGFSSSLQPGYRHDRHDGQHGFNPYRVFKFVATRDPRSPPGRPVERFQSLSGFQVRCNELENPIGIETSLLGDLAGFWDRVLQRT